LKVSWTNVAAKAAPGKAKQRKSNKDDLRTAALIFFREIVMRVVGDRATVAASTAGEASIKGDSAIIGAIPRALAL
jgi:hypothetical protein